MCIHKTFTKLLISSSLGIYGTYFFAQPFFKTKFCTPKQLLWSAMCGMHTICRMCICFSVPTSAPGVKRPGRGVDHPPPSSAGVKKGYSYTSIHPLDLFRSVMGILYLLPVQGWTHAVLCYWRPQYHKFVLYKAINLNGPPRFLTFHHKTLAKK
jgi:hypothetical protein